MRSLVEETNTVKPPAIAKATIGGITDFGIPRFILRSRSLSIERLATDSHATGYSRMATPYSGGLVPRLSFHEPGRPALPILGFDAVMLVESINVYYYLLHRHSDTGLAIARDTGLWQAYYMPAPPAIAPPARRPPKRGAFSRVDKGLR